MIHLQHRIVIQNPNRMIFQRWWKTGTVCGICNRYNHHHCGHHYQHLHSPHQHNSADSTQSLQHNSALSNQRPHQHNSADSTQSLQHNSALSNQHPHQHNSADSTADSTQSPKHNSADSKQITHACSATTSSTRNQSQASPPQLSQNSYRPCTCSWRVGE